MKRALIAILLMAPALACAEKKPLPDAANYTVTVHVQSSHVIYTMGNLAQHLDVVIDGKNYELEVLPATQVLPAGDYKARISKDKISTTHEYSRVYEFLFADGTTRRYNVVGESE
ncbi:MAG: hypothetical protein ABSE55_14160 [Terracidiphilus sp.]|jgi:hypothetical protein